MALSLLSSLSLGESCVIETIETDGAMRRRMLDMGIYPGSKMRCAFIASSGTPMAFWVKDTLLAMRRRDCEQIGVILGE